MPIAVISGAKRGAFRRGRYATRSIVTFTAPMISMVIGNTRRSASTLPNWKVFSLVEKKVISAAPTYAASVKTSPCAKLISSMMP